MRNRLLLPGLMILMPALGHATVEDAIEKATNPLHLSTSVALQDYYTPELYNSDRHLNDTLFRATVPLAANDWVPVPQILRLTVPMATRPQPQGYKTGPGDINLFDIFLLKQEGVKIGVGPLITADSASDDALGSGKWQGGLSAVAIKSTPGWMAGTLVQWQKSFAGDDARDDVETATFQPIFIYKFQGGWYLRSSGIWTWDRESDDYYIPVGIGGGRAWGVGGKVVSAFVEPQWTVAHDGDNLPKFTLFAGFSVVM
ncbi:hypothetical protein [Enterobacter cloacae complex sp. P24RS]|uniref:hypothetical protein n=1 Tax=Enterobacter cloacae complex sp. P24RS TaxID=2779568 RepID=UPI0018757CC3|nr:hypothetical protein [Enterobacter cloacae complex sp. P24RS]MBE4965100.1 hypothetical protein [Enterobacter cloacae complex sp. P24RS]